MGEKIIDKLDFLKIDSLEGFEVQCLEVFRYQAEKVSIYKEYVSYLGIDPKEIKSVEQIPFLPIDFFKTHQVVSEDVKTEIIFSSSGTTGQVQSKHHVGDLSIFVGVSMLSNLTRVCRTLPSKFLKGSVEH